MYMDNKVQQVTSMILTEGEDSLNIETSAR